MNGHLLTHRRFWPVFWTQFAGALNDNLFKNALVILVTLKAYTIGGASPSQTVALCGGVFILPFLVFSATAGQIADKFSKSRLLFGIKLWEVLTMLVGAYGFVTENFLLLLGTLFLLGLHSTFFGPVKYSILPQLVPQDELVSANAYVEMGTFVGVLLGTLLGGLLIASPKAGPFLVGGAVTTVAVLGALSSMKVSPLAPTVPDLKIGVNPVRPTLEVIRLTKKDRSAFLSILGISWFWFFGAAVLSILPLYCTDYLGGSQSLITFFLAFFSVGIGTGSLLYKRLTSGRLELGIIPFGIVGMSVFALDIFVAGRPHFAMSGVPGQISAFGLLASPGGIRIATDMFLLAVCGGLHLVPLYTLIQVHSDERERSRIVAGNNILNSLFMVLASVLLMVLFHFGVTTPWIFLLLALLNLVAAAYVCGVIPVFVLRLLCRVVAGVMYRLEIRGRENLPQEGPAILVCNHVSFIDWLIVAAACPRPVRFVMHHGYLCTPFAGWVFKCARVIPIAGVREDKDLMREAFERISRELDDGEVLCVFPEGKLTEDGEMNPFRSGVERMVRNNPVPVIPMALNGLWGSFFSWANGRPMTKPFRRVRSRITLTVGKPVAPDEVSAAELQESVGKLLADAPAGASS